MLRGLQDTRTPLVVAVAGAVGNVVLNVVLVYGLDLGIAGSALGTVLAQTRRWRPPSPVVVVRGARRHEGAACGRTCPASGLPLGAGVPLVVRTLSLRAALLGS